MRLCEGNDLWAIVGLQVIGHICACWSISLILWFVCQEVGGVRACESRKGTGATGEITYE